MKTRKEKKCTVQCLYLDTSVKSCARFVIFFVVHIKGKGNENSNFYSSLIKIEYLVEILNFMLIISLLPAAKRGGCRNVISLTARTNSNLGNIRWFALPPE